MKLAEIAKDFEKDAHYILQAQENAIKLKDILIRLHGNNDGERDQTNQELLLVKNDFAPNHVKNISDKAELYKYIRTQCTKQNAPWTITVILGWLSYYHKEEARIFAENRGVLYRIYPEKPGHWSANVQKHSGPIIPHKMPLGKILQSHVTKKFTYDTAIRLPHASSVLCAQFSAQGDRIVTATSKGDVAVWPLHNLKSDTSRINITNYPNSPAHACFSPDGSLLGTLEWEGSGTLWFSNVENLRKYKGKEFRHGYRPTTISFSPDGERVITAGWDGYIRIWNTDDFRLLKEIPLPPLDIKELDPDDPEDDRAVNSAYYSPCGKFIISSCTECSAAAAYEAGFIHIWDAENGTNIGKLRAHRSGACSASFSRKGNLIVTSGCDCSVRLWNAKTFAPVGVYKGKSDQRPKDYVWDAEISSDESLIVAASGDGFVNVWDIETKEIIAHLSHEGPVNMARFSPKEDKIIAACDDGNAYLWKFYRS